MVAVSKPAGGFGEYTAVPLGYAEVRRRRSGYGGCFQARRRVWVRGLSCRRRSGYGGCFQARGGFGEYTAVSFRWGTRRSGYGGAVSKPAGGFGLEV
jgi:hypothetical protein